MLVLQAEVLVLPTDWRTLPKKCSKLMLYHGIKLVNSRLDGKGLLATEFIPKNAVVWQLDAHEKKLTLEELEKLPPGRKKLAYQFKDKFIIVTDTSEYMNHSCDPNTWWQDDETLIARHNINPGDEVTYDYATAEIDERFRSKWKCNCGAKNCRIYITGKDCLSPEFQKTYERHLPSWVKEYINAHKKL